MRDRARESITSNHRDHRHNYKSAAGNRFGTGTMGKRYFHSRLNTTNLMTEMTELLWLVHPTFPYLQLSLPACRNSYLHQDFFQLLLKRMQVFDHIRRVVYSLMANSHIRDALLHTVTNSNTVKEVVVTSIPAE